MQLQSVTSPHSAPLLRRFLKSVLSVSVSVCVCVLIQRVVTCCSHTRTHTRTAPRARTPPAPPSWTKEMRKWNSRSWACG